MLMVELFNVLHRLLLTCGPPSVQRQVTMVVQQTIRAAQDHLQGLVKKAHGKLDCKLFLLFYTSQMRLSVLCGSCRVTVMCSAPTMEINLCWGPVLGIQMQSTEFSDCATGKMAIRMLSHFMYLMRRSIETHLVKLKVFFSLANLDRIKLCISEH